MAGESFQAAFDEGVFSAKFGEVTLIGDSPAPGPTEPVVEKDVNFYDYDGTLMHSYTLAEAQALTALPDGPSHDGLLFFDWNWSLEAIKSLADQVDVGALYDTDDGAAHLHIEIGKYADKTVSLLFSGTGYIDWGDGSEVEAYTQTVTNYVASHTYQSGGAYVIRVWSDSTILLGDNSGSLNCFNTSNSADPVCNLLRKAHIGTKCRPNRYALANMRQMEHLTLNPTRGLSYGIAYQSLNLVCAHMPRMDSSQYYAFWGCYSLRIATLPDNATHISASSLRDCRCLRRLRATPGAVTTEGYGFYGALALQEVRCWTYGSATSFFQNCNSLRKATLDKTSTGIGANEFAACFMLQEMDLPETVATIGAGALSGCYSLMRLRFRSATPPTVANANAFANIPTTCVVEVPAGSLATYQAATNYGSIAAQMVGV